MDSHTPFDGNLDKKTQSFNGDGSARFPQQWTMQFKQRLLDAIAANLDRTIQESFQEYKNGSVVGDSMSKSPLIDQLLQSDREQRPEQKEGSSSKDGSQRKLFVLRDSLLTQLFESDHIKTIYYIFIAVLLIFIMNSFINDFINYAMLDLRFDLIRWCFGGISQVLTLWISMFSSALFAYAAFHFWSTHNIQPFGRYSNYVWTGFYVALLLGLCSLPLHYVISYDLPIASSFIVGCEQLRFIMKIHSFVRENTPKVLQKKSAIHKKDEDADVGPRSNEADEEIDLCPPFENYLYFLFAPTLIYSDNYPKTKCISWRYVVICFAQVLACIFYCYYIFAHFCVPVFQNFNSDHVTAKTFMRSWFGCVLPGALCMFLGFFAMLHSWMNGFAEMLRFGDRMFYKDWWNSTTFANYYRTWNVIVHDWLHTYIYRDCCQVLGMKNRNIVLLVVFLLSALMHEYVLALALKFFYPVMFIEFFGFGVMIMFVTQKRRHRNWNILLWVSLFMGCGLLICLYSMEWYARKNCTEKTSNVLQWLLPRSLTCSVYHLHA